MNDKKNISGLIHHLSRHLTTSANRKWIDIGYPDIRTTHVSILIRIEGAQHNHNLLAKALGISRQAISKLNHELIENGYLIGSPSQTNKKSETLSLSSKGQRFLKDFKKANLDLEKSLTEVLGKNRFDEFKSSLLILDDFFKQEQN